MTPCASTASGKPKQRDEPVRPNHDPTPPPSTRLVLVTRYPTPGRAKTRLIPALGAQRAAALHRRLAERTLATLDRCGAPVEVRSTGAPVARFRRWLGDVAIIDQGDGDLGARLVRASAPEPVIFVGADAPDLAPHHVAAARAALATAPVVIGPAEDGGYWLIGLARPVPSAFADVPWGTADVLARTLERLAAAGIAPAMLETLADLDRPEDLARWPGLEA